MTVIRTIKVTPEEAKAFRDRVKRQNEEFLANLIVIPVDEFLELAEQVSREDHP